MDHGRPNFNVNVNYITAPRLGSLLTEDTLMAQYFLTVQENGVEKKYVGQMDYARSDADDARTLEWYIDSNGKRAEPETSAELNKCLWMAISHQFELQQNIGDIRPILEAQQNERKR